MAQTTIDQTDHTQRAGVVSRIVAYVVRLLVEAHDRRAMKSALGGLSDRHLRDIGLTENDVTSAVSSPLAEDAAAELELKARQRSANW